MKKLFTLSVFLSSILVLLTTTIAFPQTSLPIGFSADESTFIHKSDYKEPFYKATGITTAPIGSLRAMAQWEEIQGLTITWTNYQTVLREIVRAARAETQVYIICGNQCSGSTDSTGVKNYLTQGGVALTNVHYVYGPCNSVWARDYNANSVYMNDVDSLVMVDWKYNRPRPNDDTVSHVLARKLGIPLYETTQWANTLIHTGGNYMSDGLGTAFSSKLILDENPSISETQVDNIMNDFMGINRYIKMETLPYDGIHHIDMHMKLLNEETLLVGEYPLGVSDGPQIEANLQYVLSNYNSVFGSPYKVIRMPQPPDQMNGYTYPDGTFNGGNYLTYTNSSIINKTIIVPQYYQEYDTTALRIFREAMPGYNVVGINSNSTISASGSLHCITHSVGVKDPLLIVHQSLNNTTNTTTPYQVDARIQHKSGIQSATLYFTNDTTVGFSSIAMSFSNVANNVWTGFIPPYPTGTHVFYYIKAHANSGKEQVRPMPAPRGNFNFYVLGASTGIVNVAEITFFMKPAFPNPSHGITCIPVSFKKNTRGAVKLIDMIGKEVALIYEGTIDEGEKNFFINTLNLSAGVYFIKLETPEGCATQKLMVR